MKKIPTLFERVFDKHHKVGINNKVHPGMEWVLGGEGTATEKIDGSCCAVIDGVFYKRYDAKRGKIPPANAIPCCDPDPITGHWPHWIPVDESDKSNIWFMEAYRNAGCPTEEGTYEAIGPHFRANPYGLEKDVIEKHGTRVLPDVPRNFEGIRDYLEKHNIEGIVFWNDGQPQCKIKRNDFGFPWGE